MSPVLFTLGRRKCPLGSTLTKFALILRVMEGLGDLSLLPLLVKLVAEEDRPRSGGLIEGSRFCSNTALKLRTPLFECCDVDMASLFKFSQHAARGPRVETLPATPTKPLVIVGWKRKQITDTHKSREIEIEMVLVLHRTDVCCRYNIDLFKIMKDDLDVNNCGEDALLLLAPITVIL